MGSASVPGLAESSDKPHDERYGSVGLHHVRAPHRHRDPVAELIVEDFVLEWPNARVRIRGRTNFVEFNRRYPEGWSIEVLRIVAQGNTAVSEVHVPAPDGWPLLRAFVLHGRRGSADGWPRVLGRRALRGTGCRPRSLVRADVTTSMTKSSRMGGWRRFYDALDPDRSDP
jgi:hypothetical protein